MRNLALLSAILALVTTFAISQQPETDKGRTGSATAAPKESPDSSQASGQNPSHDGENSPGMRTAEIPAHTEINAVLDTSLSRRTSRAGDRFTATISQPIRDSSGVAVIPAGSKLMGEIADDGSLPERARSQLRLHFSEISLPNGQKVPITSALSIGDKSGNKELNVPAQTPLVLRLEKPAAVAGHGPQ